MVLGISTLGAGVLLNGSLLGLKELPVSSGAQSGAFALSLLLSGGLGWLLVASQRFAWRRIVALTWLVALPGFVALQDSIGPYLGIFFGWEPLNTYWALPLKWTFLAIYPVYVWEASRFIYPFLQLGALWVGWRCAVASLDRLRAAASDPAW